MWRLLFGWCVLGATMRGCLVLGDAESGLQLDDSWKRDLYTNRTLRLDQDPLHVAYASRRRDARGHGPNANCTEEHTCDANHGQCCHDVYDCELCQLLKGYKTVDAIELLNEIIKILETQDDLFATTCSDLSDTIETSCVISPLSWRL